ncbi:uncharacterized protein LOC123011726 [Tribolium madens]|uniref:uncharacterized protein LOC123011726 n=1 Tax=Tribolium madens TaxID=41895 RepID=UPI001CF72005|nr:uncharacterized protein LOC123011726 [Tribolium madens]
MYGLKASKGLFFLLLFNSALGESCDPSALPSILFVIFAIYATRKYKLVAWLQRKIHQRNNNYDEFMIGQEDDDPPLR